MTTTLSYSNGANKHSTFWCRNRFVLAILFFASVVGCVPKSTPTQTVYPTSIAHCFSQSVFTADDMRARVDCHPDDYKIKFNNDTVVLLAFPHPVIDWVGPIFIIHIPSVSDVVVNIDGSIFYEVYNSSEGKDAIQSVLNNQELMARILERAKDIESGSQP
jgi:hypothetical protein